MKAVQPIFPITQWRAIAGMVAGLYLITRSFPGISTSANALTGLGGMAGSLFYRSSIKTVKR